jgi:hypothetical protein
MIISPPQNTCIAGYFLARPLRGPVRDFCGIAIPQFAPILYHATEHLDKPPRAID